MKTVILSLLLFTQFSFAENSPVPSIDVFAVKTGKDVNYIFQGKRTEYSKLKGHLKKVFISMGKTCLINLHIDSKINLSELHKHLKLLKTFNFQNAQIIINQNDGSSVIIPIKLEKLDFDFREIVTLPPE